MGIESVRVVTCDQCGQPVTDPRHVDASVYGAAFHEGCWKNIGGPAVARLLGLDDIDVHDAAGHWIEGAC